MSATLTAAQLGRTCLPHLTFFHEVDKGGHFAAWEQPEVFSEELWAAFRSPALAGAGDGRRSQPAAGSTPPFTEAIVEADSY
jgi:hypothetical protein